LIGKKGRRQQSLFYKFKKARKPTRQHLRERWKKTNALPFNGGGRVGKQGIHFLAEKGEENSVTRIKIHSREASSSL